MPGLVSVEKLAVCFFNAGMANRRKKPERAGPDKKIFNFDYLDVLEGFGGISFLRSNARQFLPRIVRRTSIMGSRRLLKAIARHPWG